MGMALLTPDSIDMLGACLQEATPDTQIISGGTDMLIHLRQHGFEGAKLIDLSGVQELKFIKEDTPSIQIGALTTLNTIAWSKVLQEHVPALCAAADQVGSTQIRNSATIGGNVANAFAGADLIPPLIALGAQIDILGKQGIRRSVSIDDFICGNRKNTLEPGEVIEQIRIDKKNTLQYFGKIGSRSRVTISKLNMAAVIETEGSTITKSSIVFGALGARAFNSTSVQTYLKGKEISDITLDALSEVMKQQVDDAIPTRASRHYKREAVKALAAGLIDALASECEVAHEKSV